MGCPTEGYKFFVRMFIILISILKYLVFRIGTGRFDCVFEISSEIAKSFQGKQVDRARHVPPEAAGHVALVLACACDKLETHRKQLKACERLAYNALLG